MLQFTKYLLQNSLFIRYFVESCALILSVFCHLNDLKYAVEILILKLANYVLNAETELFSRFPFFCFRFCFVYYF